MKTIGTILAALLVCGALVRADVVADDLHEQTASGRGHPAVMATTATAGVHVPSVNIASATGTLQVDSGAAEVGAAITRPADTTAYTAGDVVSTSGGAVLSFAATGPSGGYVVVTAAKLRLDIASIPSGMGSFRLHLYNASPSAIADNAAFDLPSGDRAKYLGYMDIGPPTDIGATLWSQTNFDRMQVKLAAASTTLYGILETRAAYTPNSASVATVTLDTAFLAR